jgi:UDP-glucose 4-epimerase
VFHVAGIAHIKETSDNQELYYKVNRDLAFKTAQKAKEDGVGQFIFLSSMSVYGLETGVIDKNTPLQPNSAYGKSKLEAEELVNDLQDGFFAVAIIRPPMVYGKGCKGNYPRLADIALKAPVFPKVNNERSMIFIDNLSEFVRLVIDNELSGLLFPQNKEYVNTTEMVKQIASAHGRKLRVTGLFNLFVSLGIRFSRTFGKVFGSFVYNKRMPGGPEELDYETSAFKESIELTEK